MRKISVNKNDSSFKNKHKFKDLLFKIKTLGGSIIKSGPDVLITGALVGTLLFSATNIYKFGRDLISTIDYSISLAAVDDEIQSNNDSKIEELLNSSILVVNLEASMETDYHFENNNLVDKEGNIINLDGVDKPLYFVKCNISDETFENIGLASSKTTLVSLDYSSVDDNFVRYLPETLEVLSLNDCHYITNLNELPNRCPNIKTLSLEANASLSDLSFIYRLPNLESLDLYDSAYVTRDLLEYLRYNNISTNLTEQDVINSERVDGIIRDIIKPGMSDKEKIQAVCLYIIDNVKYDVHQTLDSNRYPLSCVLEDGKGVCASYAYFTNVLLNKAGINSFEITDDNHGWNLVEVDDKYYYVDTTNMDDGMFYNFLLRTLNITKFYMVDTSNTFLTVMSSPENDVTMIPPSLIEDIKSGRDEKTMWEKYGGQVGNIGFTIAGVLAGLSAFVGPFLIAPTFEQTTGTYEDIMYDYNNEMTMHRYR